MRMMYDYCEFLSKPTENYAWEIFVCTHSLLHLEFKGYNKLTFYNQIIVPAFVMEGVVPPNLSWYYNILNYNPDNIKKSHGSFVTKAFTKLLISNREYIDNSPYKNEYLKLLKSWTAQIGWDHIKNFFSNEDVMNLVWYIMRNPSKNQTAQNQVKEAYNDFLKFAQGPNDMYKLVFQFLCLNCISKEMRLNFGSDPELSSVLYTQIYKTCIGEDDE